MAPTFLKWFAQESELSQEGNLKRLTPKRLTYGQTMRYVILPQAWRIMLPPLTNQVVNLIKIRQQLPLFLALT